MSNQLVNILPINIQAALVNRFLSLTRPTFGCYSRTPRQKC